MMLLAFAPSTGTTWYKVPDSNKAPYMEAAFMTRVASEYRFFKYSNIGHSFSLIFDLSPLGRGVVAKSTNASFIEEGRLERRRDVRI